MSLVGNMVKETSVTTGTGTLSLDGATFGFQSFVAADLAGLVYYTIQHATLNEWEVGIGVITDAAPDTLTRAGVLESSNAGSAVNFSAGTKEVICSNPAGILILKPVPGVSSDKNTDVLRVGLAAQLTTVNGNLDTLAFENMITTPDGFYRFTFDFGIFEDGDVTKWRRKILTANVSIAGGTPTVTATVQGTPQSGGAPSWDFSTFVISGDDLFLRITDTTATKINVTGETTIQRMFETITP